MPWQPRLPGPNLRGGRAEIDPVWLCSSISIELCSRGPAGLACLLSISSYHLLLADASDGNLTFQAIKSDGNQLAPPRHAAMRASEQGDKGSDFACSHNRGGGCIHVHGRVHPRQCSASLWSALQFTSSAFAATSAATKRGHRARVSTKSFSTYWAH